MPRPLKFELDQKVRVNHPQMKGVICVVLGRTQFAGERAPNEYLVGFEDEKGLQVQQFVGESKLSAADELSQSDSMGAFQ